MKMSLKKFKENFLEKILSFLWWQWSLLGVSGYSGTKDSWTIDPEALVLFSLSMCRYDARLYDEIMDWLFKNGEFINVQRLTSMLEKYSFSSGPQISSAAEYLSKNTSYMLKWKKLSSKYKNSKREMLFLTKAGREIPVSENPDPIFKSKGLLRNLLSIRNNSREFPITGHGSLLLRLRAFLGINARCEIICLLGSIQEVHSSEVARQTCYYKKTVQKALLEMSRSGIVQSSRSGREKHYRLKPGILDAILSENNQIPEWIQWAPFLRGLEETWFGIQNIKENIDPLLLSSELRGVMKKSRIYFDEMTPSIFMINDRDYPGEKFISIYFDEMEKIILRLQ